MGNLKACDDNHEQILYQSTDCPVCLLREQLDEVLDAKTDIDQENILDLYKRVEAIEKIVNRPDAKKFWWSRRDS